MLLRKLYSKPEGLFDPIIFEDGINIIYAKKDNDKDKKKPLNGVGKSLVLNFIDYCLLSNETAHIKSAKKNNDLEKYSIGLEFEIDSQIYVIERSFKTPNKNILFGKKEEELEQFNNTTSDKRLKSILCDLIFLNTDYEGYYSNSLFRKLLPFFIKKQESKEKVNFKDPINYLHSQSKAMELVMFHLFFIGIDNTLSKKNFEIVSEIKKKEPFLEEVEKLIKNKYKIDSIAKAENEKDKLKNNLIKLENNISNFNLEDNYKDAEKRADELTSKIKGLMYENLNSKQKIASYEESFDIIDKINIIKIENLYKELNSLLAGNIKKTLEDAIDFRKTVSQHRQKFIASEMENLNDLIKEKEEDIRNFELERKKLFDFLDSKEAIRDLQEAYLILSQEREKIAELESKIKTYQDFKIELSKLKSKDSDLYVKLQEFCREIESKISEFRNYFFATHDAIYPKDNEKSGLIFDVNKDKDCKLDIKIEIKADLAYGVNKARTLIYDFTILFYALDQNRKLPRFLIHDGIFDGISKTQFIHLYEYLDKLKSEGKKFQYIFTLNEEGELSEKFGNTDKITPEKIEKEAALILTPSKKFLGNSW